VGLLLLDEPTTFLDADTIKSFNNALEKLREFAAAANIQVVIVTHCTDLIPAFDGVIQL
jgi:DNA repair exonuclease SbcCD ATPase subunit